MSHPGTVTICHTHHKRDVQFLLIENPTVYYMISRYRVCSYYHAQDVRVRCISCGCRDSSRTSAAEVCSPGCSFVPQTREGHRFRETLHECPRSLSEPFKVKTDSLHDVSDVFTSLLMCPSKQQRQDHTHCSQAGELLLLPHACTLVANHTSSFGQKS